jgi:hypothetical protein
MSVTPTMRQYPLNSTPVLIPPVDDKGPRVMRLRTLVIARIATGIIALAGAVALSSTVFAHTGPIGPRGLQGTPGLRGPAGFAGPTGPRGRVGRTGAMGAIGEQGAAGSAGATGADGADGADGAPAGNQDLGTDGGFAYGTAADGSACDDSPSSSEPCCPF